MTKRLLDYMKDHDLKICIWRLRHFILDTDRIPVDVVADEVKCLRDMCQMWDEKKEICGICARKD